MLALRFFLFFQPGLPRYVGAAQLAAHLLFRRRVWDH